MKRNDLSMLEYYKHLIDGLVVMSIDVQSESFFNFHFLRRLCLTMFLNYSDLLMHTPCKSGYI